MQKKKKNKQNNNNNNHRNVLAFTIFHFNLLVIGKTAGGGGERGRVNEMAQVVCRASTKDT